MATVTSGMHSISHFLNWWLAQLVALLPPSVVGASGTLADAVILEQDAQQVRLSVRRRGIVQKLPQTRAGGQVHRDLANAFAEQRRKLPRRVVIRLPTAQVLRKSVVLPTAARRNLAGVLGFEIDRETPFQREEVHWTYLVHGQDTRAGLLNVELILAPRAHVDPVLKLARASGLDPVGIEVEAGSGVTTVVPLGSRKRGQWLDAQRPLMPLATAASVLAIVAAVTPFALQQWELARVEARISALEAPAREAATYRQQAGQVAATIDFLAKERAKSGSALAALAAATKSLPDDSYLSALSLRAGRLTMNGLSPSAAQLIGLLAQAPEFREPIFEAPVTRYANDEFETFAISVALAPAGAP